MFKYCPYCREPLAIADMVHQISCHNCNFTYFHNMASSAAAIIRYQNEILLIRRAKEPGKGLWDLPGGFVDPGESLEAGIARELMEELKLNANRLRYFTSEPNTYEYRGIVYATCDAVFFQEFSAKPMLSANDGEVHEYRWVALNDIDINQLAFNSMRRVLERYLNEYSSK